MSRRKRTRNPYQKADRFTVQAKEEGFAARSVFKLQEIQRRFRLLKPGMKAVDLGCAPGSWWKFAAQCVGREGAVLGVDITEPEVDCGPLLVRSVLEVTPEDVFEALGGPPQVVLSDMAPRTTGDGFGDHVRQIELARTALALAAATVPPGGAFVTKVFDGEEAPTFVNEIRSHFGKLKRVKPEAVRRVSREFFVVAQERRES